MTDQRKDEMPKKIALRIAERVANNFNTTVMYDAAWIVEDEILSADLSPPVPDDVAGERIMKIHAALTALKNAKSVQKQPMCSEHVVYIFGEKEAELIRTELIRAATTPSTPTVSEEDKARALRALETIANQKTSKEWEEEGDTEYAYDFIINLVRDALFTIRTLLLPTPRGEG